MKKIITLSLLSALTLIGGISTNNNVSPIGVDAETVTETITNTSSSWDTTFGSGFNASDITNGVRIGNLKGTYVGMYMKEKVALDGLSFTFNNVIGANCKAGGFYFSQKTSHEFSKNVFTLWHDPYNAKQSRLNIGTSHDYNDPRTCYTTPDFTETGFAAAQSMVMNNNMSENDGFNIKIEKYSLTAWKVTISQLYANTLWENNANFDTATKSCSVYLKASDVSSYLDNEGKAYMHVFGIDDSATAAYYEITNMSRTYKPAKPVTKNEVKDLINSVTDEMINSYINKPELIEEYTAAKKKALDSLNDAPESGLSTDYPKAFEFIELWEARVEKYGYTSNTSSILNDLPFVSSVGINGAQLSPNKDVQLTLDGNYGNRIYSKEVFDAANVEISLNLSQLKLYSALPLSLNKTATPSNYVSESGKYYFFEFYKIADDKYFVVLGNGNSHNISIDGFNSEKQGSYTGRVLNSYSGDIKIKVSTDFETTITKFDFNNGQISYEVTDNSLLFSGENPTKAVDTNLCFGLMNCTGKYQVMVSKMFSPDNSEKVYTKGSESSLYFIYSADDPIESIKCDDVEIEKIGYNIIDNKKIQLSSTFLNYIGDGTHKLTMKAGDVTTSWSFNVNPNTDVNEVPWIKKGAVYFKEGNANDEVYPFESYGIDVNNLIFKLDDNVMDKSSYEFTSYNTVLTIKASLLNTLSKGNHMVSIVKEGAKVVVKLPIIVK